MYSGFSAVFGPIQQFSIQRTIQRTIQQVCTPNSHVARRIKMPETIATFLATHDLSSYAAACEDHGWDSLPALQAISDDDLKQLVADVEMKSGHAARLRSALLDGSSDEDKPVSGEHLAASPGKPDFFVTLPQAGVYYSYALDSLYENDMLESVPVAPGEQSLYEQAVAAARALAASRARELSHKRKQRGSAPPAAIAVASWRRYR